MAAPFPRLLETARLALTPAGSGDGDLLHELWAQPAVRRPLWRGDTLSREQSRELAARSAWLHEQQGHGLWLARRHGEQDLAGVGGYWFLHDDHHPELLYAVEPRLWGHGLATELVHALVAYGWSVLGLAELRATTESHNQASVRLLRRLGFMPPPRGRGAPGTVLTFRMRPATVDDSWGT